MSGTIEELIKCRNSELPVRFIVGNISVTNDGIGSYEYHGAKGFDAGTDYVEEFKPEGILVWSDRRGCFVAPSRKLLIELTEAIPDDEDANEQVNAAYWRDKQDGEDEAADHKLRNMRGER